jgi:hypothetical protein
MVHWISARGKCIISRLSDYPVDLAPNIYINKIIKISEKEIRFLKKKKKKIKKKKKKIKKKNQYYFKSCLHYVC